MTEVDVSPEQRAILQMAEIVKKAQALGDLAFVLQPRTAEEWDRIRPLIQDMINSFCGFRLEDDGAIHLYNFGETTDETHVARLVNA